MQAAERDMTRYTLYTLKRKIVVKMVNACDCQISDP